MDDELNHVTEVLEDETATMHRPSAQISPLSQSEFPLHLARQTCPSHTKPSAHSSLRVHTNVGERQGPHEPRVTESAGPRIWRQRSLSMA